MTKEQKDISTTELYDKLREVAIKELKESIDKVKKFIDHNNKSKEKAESLLKRGEKLLQKYQGAA
jgi:ABC-type transporter Mla subunit MlaD